MAQKKVTEKVDNSATFTRVFEDENIKSIWTYNFTKHKYGPISTETEYKNEPIEKKVSKKKSTKK